jgi:hypothetical protein
MQADRPLWSENVSYPHPRRVIHSYPQRMDPSFHSIPSSTAHVTQNTEKDRKKAKRNKKEDPPKRAFLQESSEQNRCTTTSS